MTLSLLALSPESLLWATLSPVLYGYICIKANRAQFDPVLIAAFVVGFLTSYVAYVVEASLVEAGFLIPDRLAWFGFSAFVALPEETVKLAALIGLMSTQPSANRVALVVACFIGCGFAASENLIYLARFGGNVISLRLFTATAFHVFNAIIMARLLVTSSIKDGAIRIVFALILPTLLHGTYDYLLGQATNDGGRFVFVLGFAVAAGFTTLRAYSTNSR